MVKLCTNVCLRVGSGLPSWTDSAAWGSRIPRRARAALWALERARCIAWTTATGHSRATLETVSGGVERVRNGSREMSRDVGVLPLYRREDLARRAHGHQIGYGQQVFLKQRFCTLGCCVVTRTLTQFVRQEQSEHGR